MFGNVDLPFPAIFLPEHFPHQTQVISSQLEDVLRLKVSDGEIIQSYLEKFEKFGLKFKPEEDEMLAVTHVPHCFVLREENDLKNFRPSPLVRLTRTLIEDIVDDIRTTRGAGLSVLPKTLNYVLCSRACRGAVKFGDAITQDRCVDLLKQLGRCHLPFQCAHGRPSLAPIVDVNKIRLSAPKRQKTKLNFARLRMLKNSSQC